MPDIDTSPAALRALADDKNPWSDGPIWPFKWLPVIRDVLRAIADEKEKAEAERDAALRLLSDRPGHAVAGRDFTTVASAVLAAFPPCDPADPCAVAFNLASERKTVEMLRDEAEERALDAEIRAGRMRAALQKIMKTTSNGMRWEDKVAAIEEIASDALEEQEAGE